jgi:hypothetical protein
LTAHPRLTRPAQRKVAARTPSDKTTADRVSVGTFFTSNIIAAEGLAILATATVVQATAVVTL